MDEAILLELYTVIAYNLSMGMKEDDPSPQNIKGDKSKEIIICVSHL